MLTFLAPVTLTVGALGATLPCLQIAKMIRERNAHGISLPFVAGGLGVTVIWTLYAFALGKTALIVPNLVALTVAVVHLAAVIVLRARHPGRESLQPGSA
jgi:uncharacterized protein with PQ loop repeat